MQMVMWARMGFIGHVASMLKRTEAISRLVVFRRQTCQRVTVLVEGVCLPNSSHN